MNGNTRLVKRLYSRGADLTLRDEEGARPLDIAVARQFSNIAGILVRQTEKSVLIRESNTNVVQAYYNVTSSDTKMNKGTFRIATTIFFIFVIIPASFICGNACKASEFQLLTF